MGETVSALANGLRTRISGLVRQPLFANAGYLMGAHLVAPLVGFLFWGVAAWLYPPESVGVATAILSALTLVAGTSRLGLDSGLIRFLPEAQQPARLLNTVLTFNAVTALAAGIVFLAGLPLWSPSLAFLRQDTSYAGGFLAFAVVTTLGTMVNMAFVAHRQAQYALFHTCIANGGRLVLMVALVGLGVAGLVVSAGFSALLTLGISLTLFMPRVEAGYRLRHDLSWPDLAAVLPYSMGNYAAGLLAQAPIVALPLLILELLGPSAGGYASVTWALGSALSIPGTALAQSAFAESSNAPDRLNVILRKAAAPGLLVTLPASLTMALGAPWALYLFGPGYAREAAGLLRWLSGAAPLAVIVALHFARLRVLKQLRHLNVQSGLIAAITLGLSAALLPRLGISASGIAWLFGNGLVAAIAVGRVIKESRVETQRGGACNA